MHEHKVNFILNCHWLKQKLNNEKQSNHTYSDLHFVN